MATEPSTRTAAARDSSAVNRTISPIALTDNNNLDDARLVTVAERPDEVSASILVAALTDAGIRAVATGGFTAGFRAEAPGMVRVKTLESDAQRARQIIAELKAQPPDQWNVEESDENDRD